MSAQTLDPPGLSPGSGSYTSSVTITLSSTQAGATIRYTTDGTTPTASSTVYSSPLVITTTTTLTAKAFHPEFTTSADASASYTLTAATPTLSVAGGAYAPGSDVTIATTEATATLRMTLDGTDPTSSSVTVASGTSLLLGNFTLKVRAFRTGATESAVAGTSYTLTGPLGPGSVASGTSHSVLATTDGRVLAWGSNSSSQIGDGTTTARTTPVLVQGVTGITMVAAGMAQTFAVTADGRLYAWGSNGSGRLGDGTTTPRPTPIVVPGLATIDTVAAGDQHTLALLSDGRVYAWGENGSGQLGLGSTTDAWTPTEITALANVVAIAAGSAHSLAVTASGQLYAWGLNTNGRLGDGTTTMRTSPVLIGLSDVMGVAAGYAHSLALTSSGAVYSWGAGTNGQLGRGTLAGATTPTVIPGVFASEIMAGDFFSAALRHDGVYVAWGANSSGQVGDTTTTQRLSPVIVTGPVGVSRLALGGAHTLAATAAGELWTWGSGVSGKLGDGTTTERPTPQAVITGLEAWYPAAPALTLPSGTLSTASIVTVTSPTSGAVIRYTTDGTEPTAGAPEVPANGQVWITDASFFRARAFVSGRSPGAIARANYELPAATPVITPATGTYTSAQTVTMTASGVPASIRYTTDGSEPTETSTLYAGSLIVATATTIKAKTYPSNGWSPSPTATATLTLNYGTLDTPVATPDGGAFQQAPQVTLSSNAGASIRYTLDGTTPTEASTLYAAPFTLPAGGGEVKAKAFLADWTPSSVMSASYMTDTVAPTIAAIVEPSPNAAGWNNTPVTVRFTCSDNIAGVNCPTPVYVEQATSGQQISRTATDSAGNSASVSVVIAIDPTAPEVTRSSPSDGLLTSSSIVSLTADAADALSGIAGATCNGEPASLSGNEVTCTVALHPGRNWVVVSVVDTAGNSRSSGARVTRTGTPTRLVLTPAERTLLITERGPLSLTDDFGILVSGAMWDSSDDAIVTLSSDDPPEVSALAPGTTTISATKDGMTAEATITVVAGATIPDGTTRWSVAPTLTPGFGTQSPIYADRVEEDGPAMFGIERDWQFDTTKLRALSPLGEVLWTADVNGWPIMGDSFGGLLLQMGGSAFPALARVGGGTNALPWRYESSGGLAQGQVAQAPDGTIYAVEVLVSGATNTDGSEVTDAQVLVLDGATGSVTARVPLPREVVTFDSQLDGYQSCTSSRREERPETVGPIIGADGFGYLLVREYVRIRTGLCDEYPFDPTEVDRGVKLLRLGQSGLVSSTIVLSEHCSVTSTACDAKPMLEQVVPDLIGGTLVIWRHTPQGGAQETRLTHFASGPDRTDRVLPGHTSISLVGDEGTAYIVSGIAAEVVRSAVDIETWTTKWTFDGAPLMALHNGGLMVKEGTLLKWLEGDGALRSTHPLAADSASSVVKQGEWISVDQDSSLQGKPVRSIAGPIPVPTRSSFGQITSRPLGVYSSCVPPPFIDVDVAADKRNKGLSSNRDYTVMFERQQGAPLWPANDHDNDLIPSVLLGFELWESANIELGGPFPARRTSFTKITSGTPDISLIHDENIDLGIDPTTGQPVYGLSNIGFDAATGISSGGTITWDNVDVSQFEFFKKVSVHEIGHFMGLGHGISFGPPTSVMNTARGYQDALGQVSQVVTVCDRDKAAEAATRSWPIP